jgi:glutamate formiminotransferase/glutamate formiminotransferase/formiminotetrahydrofolate cyclodeaminase
VAQFSLVQVTPPLLLAVPNVSEGRDAAAIAAIGRAFAGAAGAPESSTTVSDARAGGPDGVRLLDAHSDPDHNRSVFTLAAPRTQIADTMLRGARAAMAHVDVMQDAADGQHPRVGALDVAPIVYLDEESRGAACAEALVVADRIGMELQVPVFLYGELAGGRTRAQLRRGGVRGLAERMAAGDSAEAQNDDAAEEHVRPDFGPARLHPTAGATLVAARAPLVAFNVRLSPQADIADARRIAALIREGGSEGLPGVRAIGVALSEGVAQVSMNVENPLEVPLAVVIDAVSRHARVASGEIVGLAPSAALERFPDEVPLPGFDPERQVLEKALRSYSRGSD